MDQETQRPGTVMLLIGPRHHLWDLESRLIPRPGSQIQAAAMEARLVILMPKPGSKKHPAPG